jgi:hypothetical protein
MKKVVKQFKQALSVLLAVAMVVTMIPETSAIAFANELEDESTIAGSTGNTYETQGDIVDSEIDPQSDETPVDDEDNKPNEYSTQSEGSSGGSEQAAKTATVTFSIDAGATVSIVGGDDLTSTSGDDLNQTVTVGDSIEFTVDAGDNNKVKSVSTDSEGNNAISQSKGNTGDVYRVTPSDETAITVYVKVAQLASDVGATFTASGDSASSASDIEVYKVSDAYVEGTTSITDSALATGFSAWGNEGDTVRFSVKESATSINKITKVEVEVDGETKTLTKKTNASTEQDYYEFTLGATNAEVTITTAIDATMANSLTLETEGATSGITDVDDISVKGKVSTAALAQDTSDVYVSHEAEATIMIPLTNGYEVASATQTVDGTTKKITFAKDAKDGYAEWSADVTLGTATSTKSSTVTVTIEGAASGDDKDVKIVNADKEEKNVKVNVTSSSATYNKTGEKAGTYTITTGSKNLTFTVDVKEGRTPAVTYGADGDADPTEVSYSGKVTDVTYSGKNFKRYTYIISNDDTDGLQDGDIINVSATTTTHTLAFDSTTGIKKFVVANADDATEKAQENKKNGNSLVEGDDYTITLTPNSNTSITKVEIKVGSGEKEELTGSDGVYTITAPDDDSTVYITTSTSTGYVLKSGTTVQTEEDGVYKVSVGTYTTQLLNGEEAQKIKSVNIWDGDSKSTTTTATVSSGTTGNIKVNEADGGKNLRVELVQEGETTSDDDDEVAATYTLYVLPVSTGIALEGVTLSESKTATIEQQVDSKKEYAITMEPSTAEISTLGINVKSSANVTAEIDKTKGALVITTPKGTTTRDSAATITLSDSAKGTTLATLTVKTVKPALTETTPEVTKKSVADDELNITVTVPEEVITQSKELVNGEVWYQIDTTRDIEDVTTVAAYTKYVKVTEASQDVAVSLEDVFNTAYGSLTAAQKAAFDSLEDYQTDKWATGESYTVKVSLIQTLSKDVQLSTALSAKELTAATAFNGKEAGTLAVQTEKPYYESNLTLGAGETTALTAGAKSTTVVATAVFSENTNQKKLNFSGSVVTTDKTDLDYTRSDKIYVAQDEEDATKIVAQAGGGVAAGKYTITVSTDMGKSNAVPSTATFTVSVAQGAIGFTWSVPSLAIFKDAGKAATLKVKAVPTTAEGKAQSGKVTYEIVDADKKSLAESKVDALVKAVSAKTLSVDAKSGTVKVAKDYAVDAKDAANNTFRIKATDTNTGLVDYTEPIVVTSAKITLGAVVLLEGTEDGNYKLVTRTDFTRDTFDGLYVAALKTEAAQNTYTDAQLAEAAVPVSNLTFKTGKLFSVVSTDVDYLGQIYCNATKSAKNLSITVTAGDGSKAKAALKGLTLSFKDISANADYGLEIYATNDGENFSQISTDANRAGGSLSFTGSANTCLSMQLLQKDAKGNWSTLDDLYDIKVSVSGGKVLGSGSTYRYVLANKKVVKVTLTYKDATKTTVKHTYEITNNTFDVAKAPKIKAIGTLNTDIAKVAQTLNFTVTGSTAKYALVTVDSKSAAVAKTAAAYSYLRSAMDSAPVLLDGNTFAVSFKGANIPVGSYKLSVVLGDVDSNGNFIPATKAATVQVKSVKGGVITSGAELNTTEVSLSAQGGEPATLEFTYENAEGTGSIRTLNATVDGAANKFATYFSAYAELDAETQVYSYKLKLNSLGKNFTLDDLSALVSESGAANRTGYIQYTYTDAYGDEVTDSAPITVSFKAAATGYTLPTVSVMKPSTGSGKVTADVSVVDEEGVAVALADVLVTDSVFSAAHIASGATTVQLTSTKAVVGDNAVTLYVVPVTSTFAAKIAEMYEATLTGTDTEKAAAKTKYENAIKTYGVKVSGTVKVTNADETEGKLSISENNLAQTFTSDSYDTTTQAYVVTVPYTETVQCTPNAAAVSADYNYFTPAVNADKNEIKVSLARATLEEKVEAGTLAYGQTVTVPVTVSFSDSKKSETFELALTLPAEPSKTFDEALSDLQKATDDISKAVTVDYWAGIKGTDKTTLTNVSDKTLEEYKESEDAFLGYTVQKAIADVEAEIAKVVPNDSGAIVKMTQFDETASSNKGTITIKASQFDAPKSTTDGYLIITADVYKNTTAGGAKPEGSFTYKLAIAPVEQNPADFIDALEAFEAKNKTTYTNDTTKEDILADAKAYLELDKYETITLEIVDAEKDDFVFSQAAEDVNGRIAGTFKVSSTTKVDAEGNAVSATTNFDFTIKALSSLKSAASAITTAIGELAADSDYGDGTNLYNNITADVILNTAKAAVNNDTISVDWKQTEDSEDDIEIEKADREGTGSVVGNIELTQGEETATVPVSETIAQLKTLAAAVTDVEGATGTTSWDTSELGTFIKTSQDEAAVKAEILKAANDAVKNQSITVTYVDDTWEFVAAGYKAGSISFKLQLTDDLDEDAAAEECTAVKDEELPALDDAVESLDEAVIEVQEALQDEEAGEDGNYSNAFLTALKDNSIKNDDAGKKALREAIATAVSGVLYTANLKHDDTTNIVINPAGVKEGDTGLITFTVVLKDVNTGLSRNVEASIVIPMEVQDVTTAAAAAEKAIEELTFTNADFDFDDNGAVTEAGKKKLEDAIKAAINDGFEIDYDTGKELTASLAATAQTTGTAAVTVTISVPDGEGEHNHAGTSGGQCNSSLADGTYHHSTDEVTYTLPVTDEDPETAQTKAEAALNDYVSTSAASAPTQANAEAAAKVELDKYLKKGYTYTWTTAFSATTDDDTNYVVNGVLSVKPKNSSTRFTLTITEDTSFTKSGV